MTRDRIVFYVRRRVGEASTWRGIVLILTAAGVPLNPAQGEAVIAGGLALAGAIGAFFPDRQLPNAGGVVGGDRIGD